MKEREEFLQSQSELDVSRVFFIDEAGCHPGIGPRRGWAPVGQRLYAPEEPYSRGKHVSMIGALTLDGIATYMTVDGGVKGKTFQRFVKQRLVPRLRPGDLVCWDNINMHKSKVVRAVIEETGASVVFLPRYSPDLNPIEAAWAKIKTIVRKAMPTTVADLKAAMRYAFRRVSVSDARGWVRYCGYSLPAT